MSSPADPVNSLLPQDSELSKDAAKRLQHANSTGVADEMTVDQPASLKRGLGRDSESAAATNQSVGLRESADSQNESRLFENGAGDPLRLLEAVEGLLDRGFQTDCAAENLGSTDELLQLREELGLGSSAIEGFSGQVSVRRIESDSEFINLRSAWESISTNPLRSFEWHHQWWREFGSNAKLRIYCLESHGEVVGIAPFCEDRWLGQTRLRFIGSGKVCTDFADLIVASPFRQKFIDCLTREIALSDEVDVIELEGVDQRGPGEAIKSGLSPEYWSYEKTIDACWYLELPSTWEQFLKDASRSLRRKIRKAEKRLSSGEVSIRSTSDGFDFEEAFDTLVELHQLRFESKGEPGVFADPKFHSFLKSATRKLCKEDRGEINISYVNSQPLAAQLYLLDDAGPQFYQGGLRTDRLDLEPGHLMFTYAVKKAIQRGSRELDFLRGDEPYKPFWGAVPRQLMTVRLAARKARPTAINMLYRAARASKRAVVRLLSASR